MTRSTLVAEEVGNWGERALVGTSTLALLELLVNHVSDKLLSLNLGKLNRARQLSLNKQLLLHEVWQRVEQRVRPWGQQLSNIVVLREELLL